MAADATQPENAPDEAQRTATETAAELAAPEATTATTQDVAAGHDSGDQEPAPPAAAVAEEPATPAEAQGTEPIGNEPAAASAEPEVNEEAAAPPATEVAEAPAGGAQRASPPKRRRERPPRRDRPPRQPQERGPLPFDELRAAAGMINQLFGARPALRDAFAALGEKERRDLSRLVAEDGDWRKRSRGIAAGSLGAGRVGKALAAQQIAMAQVEDLWTFTLSKEDAAARQERVRSARRRDEQRVERQRDRERSSERVSRAELKKAQDGRVGAQIRIVIDGQEQGRKRRRGQDAGREEPEVKPSDLLDRLGY